LAQPYPSLTDRTWGCGARENAIESRVPAPGLCGRSAWTTIPTAPVRHLGRSKRTNETTRGDDVARAKRTDRAEARRQYRAYLAAQAEAQATAEPEDDEEPARDRAAAARPPRREISAPKPGERLGMVAAAKGAFRQPHYFDDLRNIGPLVFRSRAIWPVAAVCVIAALVAYPRIGPKTAIADDPILAVTFQFILYPIPLLPPMIAGFLAPRSTWLAGALAAAVSTLTLVALLVASAYKLEGTSSQVTGANVLGVTVNWLSLALPFGALMGAASGWYKRFLDLMGAGRSRGQSKPSQKRPVRRSQTARR
jgi:hypothetical protein